MDAGQILLGVGAIAVWFALLTAGLLVSRRLK